MSVFATAVCEALEGREVQFGSLPTQRQELLKRDIETKNFSPSLRLVLDDGAMSPDLMIRMNKAIAGQQIKTLSVPVTGDPWD